MTALSSTCVQSSEQCEGGKKEATVQSYHSASTGVPQHTHAQPSPAIHTIIVNNKDICKPDTMVHTYKANTREGHEFDASLDHMMKTCLTHE